MIYVRLDDRGKSYCGLTSSRFDKNIRYPFSDTCCKASKAVLLSTLDGLHEEVFEPVAASVTEALI